MRVLHIINSLDHGGAELYALRLVNSLESTERENFVAYAKGGTLGDRFSPLGGRLLKVSDRLLNFRNPFSSLLSCYRIYTHVVALRIDLMHAHVFEAYFWSFFVSICSGVPLARTVVGMRRDVQFWSPLVEKVFSRFTRKLIVFSEISRRELQSFGVHESWISVIPNGVDIQALEDVTQTRAARIKERFGTQNCRVVGTVGRLHWHKNHEMLLKAASKVVSQWPDVRFLIDGEGPLREHLANLTESLGLSDRVIFTGWSEDVHALMASSDLFVLPSRTESAPTVVIEAMALGIPVIATNVGGLPEILEYGRVGRLVPSEDEGKLAEAILDLLGNFAARKELSHAARLHCKARFDFRTIARQVSQQYDKWLDGNLS